MESKCSECLKDLQGAMFECPHCNAPITEAPDIDLKTSYVDDVEFQQLSSGWAAAYEKHMILGGLVALLGFALTLVQVFVAQSFGGWVFIILGSGVADFIYGLQGRIRSSLDGK